LRERAERADITSNTYYDWLIDHVFLLVPAQEYVGQFLASFKEYPQRQKASSFNLDEVMSKLNDVTLLENQGLGAPPK
jgi:arylsulfatase